MTSCTRRSVSAISDQKEHSSILSSDRYHLMKPTAYNCSVNYLFDNTTDLHATNDDEYVFNDVDLNLKIHY
jgi:hypothetical protein